MDRELVGPVRLTTEQGSNNWVVDGTMTATGRPLLANDPHRPVQLPSLRKTVHLVAGASRSPTAVSANRVLIVSPVRSRPASSRA